MNYCLITTSKVSTQWMSLQVTGNDGNNADTTYNNIKAAHDK